MLEFFISLTLALILYLINGISVLKFYKIKDYLYTRAIAHFYFPSSRKMVLNKKEIVFYFLIIFSFLLSFFIDLKIKETSLIYLTILFFVLFFLRKNLIRKITFTPKTIIVSFLALSFNFVFLYFSKNNFLIFSLFLPFACQFLIFTLAIKVFDLTVKPYLNFLGTKVKKKLEKNKNLKIVGIVGSYGKSSTKEILVQLLKEKYKVLTTPTRINHEYALLKFLLKASVANFDYLVLEFGSYYLGNIKWTTKYITPEIAFITGITKQHLYLFGNIKNIIQGEGTEVLSWMNKGTLIVSSNHEYFEKLKEKIFEKIREKEIQVFTYGKDADFSYEILENNLEKTTFIFKTKEKEYLFETNLIFPMQVENLVGVLGFLSLKHNLEDFREKIKKIELPEGFLKIKIKDNLYIFDDSYNANPKGVFSSLDYFKKLDLDYKVIIFNGLLELGKETRDIYLKLKDEFLNFDKVIFFNNDFLKITKTKENKFLVLSSQKELEIFLKSLNYPKTGLWIINRLPQNIKI